MLLLGSRESRLGGRQGLWGQSHLGQALRASCGLAALWTGVWGPVSILVSLYLLVNAARQGVRALLETGELSRLCCWEGRLVSELGEAVASSHDEG